MTMYKRNYLKISGDFERAGQLASALCTLIDATKASNANPLRHIIDMNIQRIIRKAQSQARQFMTQLRTIPLFEQQNNPKTYAKDCENIKPKLPPIISFTTISSRISRVEKTVDSILKQTIKPHCINLYISKEPCLIDEGVADDDECIANIAKRGVNIYYVPNIGPYRKQVPVVAQLRLNGAPVDTPIITIDDDVVYPSNIVEILMCKLDTEESVVAHRGREIIIENRTLMPYKTFPAPRYQYSLFNIGTGKNGMAYRLKYFPLNHEDYIGHILAPTADDIWCKWVTSMYCLPTVILEPKAAYDQSLDFAESDRSDKNGLFHKYNANGTNDDAMANMECYFSRHRSDLISLLSGINNV